MAYTALSLITNAYYLSGILSVGLQTLEGGQSTLGLQLLNSILSSRTVNSRHLPYWTVYDFNLIINTEMYFIPNLVDIQTMTFFIDDIRYSMERVERDQYFGSGRITDINSLPFQYHQERVMGGSNVYVYFLPDSNYPAELTAKFSLSSVTLNQDLSLTYDQYYIDYMMYELAKRLCSFYKITLDQETRDILHEYEKGLDNFSPIDLSMVKLSCLQKSTTLNYGDLYIGRGWRPGNS